MTLRRGQATAAQGPPLLRLAELFSLLLALWAAWYHTPPGALARGLLARVIGVQSGAPPLLAYYSAGVYAQRGGDALPKPPPRPVPPERALGYAAWATLGALGNDGRAQPLRLAHAEGFAPAELLAPRTGPEQLGLLLSRLTQRLGSVDLAALALFCGEETARFAARGADGDAGLEELVRELPPGLCPQTAEAGRLLSLATALGLSWPLRVPLRISSPFGEREHPVLGRLKVHRGVDLPVPVGTPVYAAGEARVRRASEDPVSGRMLVLDHGHGVSTLYLHNDELLVREGTRVQREQPISRSGNTGLSTGPHLHYQLEIGGVAVDPMRYR